MLKLFQLDLSSQNRIFGLDLLRTIAILFVMIIHAANFLPFPTKYHHYYNAIIYDGVGIFFVLSGFLIGGIFIREIENTPRFSFKDLINFWIKRWSRTLPNYYFFAILLMLIQSVSVLDIIKHLFFVQNIAHQVHGSYIGWSWSLSVEEWFYLIIPFLIFILISIGKVPNKIAFLITIFTLILSVGGTRYLTYFNQNLMEGVTFDDIRYAVIYRIDGIMYGVLGAYLNHYHKNFWTKNRGILFFIGCLGIIFYYFFNINSGFYRWVLSFPVTSITILCLLPILNSYKSEKNPILRNTVTFISLISYSL